MIENKKARTVILCLLIVGTMVSIAYASVPFYRLFCVATGFGGTTQRVAEAKADVSGKTVTIRFDTNVDANLPWDFTPDVRNMQVKLGETNTVKFHAHNRSDKPIAGMATFNVQPDKAGQYFNKIQCFCFDRQVLQPGASTDMTVQFYVDPAIATDKDTNDVTSITLSYTFFLSKDQSDLKKDAKSNQQPETQTSTTGNPS